MVGFGGGFGLCRLGLTWVLCRQVGLMFSGLQLGVVVVWVV